MSTLDFYNSNEAANAFRTSRATIINSNSSDQDEHELLKKRFSSLGIPVLNVREFNEITSRSPESFDVVGLLGDPRKLHVVSKPNSASETRIAFVPSLRYGDCPKYLQIADAAVHCKAETKNGDGCFDVTFRFFESIIVPSMLNIDLADVRSIARGIGLAFNDSDDSSDGIIARFPHPRRLARSALLHFNCTEDVTLREVYTISKAFAWRKPEEFDERTAREDSADSTKFLRKLNVKMGIRVRPILQPSGIGNDGGINQKRISMTAILFGIQRRHFPFKAFGLQDLDRSD